MPRAALAVALAALALTVSSAAATAQETGEPPEPSARAWILVDPADDAVLDGHRASREYPVASTTKLMTAYVARRALRPAERVTAPRYVPSSSAESLLGLVAGERITARDLLYGLILASGNDAAETLAIASEGSVERFVARMNRAARGLGLDDTSYANPIGLDEQDNHSSAADLVELAEVLRRDRLMRRIFDAPSATLRSGARTRQIQNRNRLVREVGFVNGVKTGYTLDAGNVLVASGTRGGVTLISAVLGEPTESQRDADSLALLEYGLSLYRTERPVLAGENFASAEVSGQDETLALVAERGVKLRVRPDQQVTSAVEAPASVEGPIEQGERLGGLVVSVDGEPRERVALLAAREVEEASLADRIDSAVPGSRAALWVIVALVGAAGLLVALRLRARRRIAGGERL